MTEQDRRSGDSSNPSGSTTAVQEEGTPASPLVEMRKITRSFPGVVANDAVDFDLRQGEVHALLGENGAGKSTLMNVLAGFLRPDSGQIRVRGRRTMFRNPAEAIEAGIGMVHQHFKLVEPFTAAENIAMGHRDCPNIVRARKLEDEIHQITEQYGFEVDLSAKIWQLSIAEQQQVEILKALYRGAEVLILDEPTSALTPQEADELFETMREMLDLGHGIIFITHKLDEVMAVSDRVTILRDGKQIETLETSRTNEKELANLMVGRELSRELSRSDREPGDVSLRLSDLKVTDNRGLVAVSGMDLEVREGEIIGIAGISGNGQRELAESIAGLRDFKGEIAIGERSFTRAQPREAIEAGLCYIPADRTSEGLVTSMDLVENFILREYRDPPISNWSVLDRETSEQLAEQHMEKLDVRYSGLDKPVSSLSGGNQQKLLIARELSTNPSVLLCYYPTRGLDVSAIQAVHETLLTCRDEGQAILLISERLEEVFKLADRIHVLFDGELVKDFPPDPDLRDEVGLAMAGEVDSGD